MILYFDFITYFNDLGQQNVKNSRKTIQEAERFWTALKLFLSVCKSPTQSLTFHRIEISWLFFYHFSILFVSFYIILCKLSSFMRIYAFKRKKLRGNVVFTTTAICIYFASLTLICKLLFIRQILLETKISILNSQMLAFWGTLFILAIKILKAKLQTFHSNVLMRES